MISQSSILADAWAAWDAVCAARGWRIPDGIAALALSQIAFESNFGRTGTLAPNGWGAYQAGSVGADGKPVWIAAFAKAHAKDRGVGGVAHRDSSPTRGPYVSFYRIFPSQYAAADDWMSAMVPRMGLTQASDWTPEDYAAAAYRIGYYEGVHANDPESNIADYARALGRQLPSVTAARSGPKGRDPKTIDLPTPAPLLQRVGAELMTKYPQLKVTNGLAWVVGPPVGYKADGTKGVNWLPWTAAGTIGLLAIGAPPVAIGVGLVAMGVQFWNRFRK